MHRTLTALAAAAALAPLALTAPALAAPGKGGAQDEGYQFAVFGDLPYGAAQVAAFPGWIEELNADRDLRFAVHVGDIKNGSSVCSDEYFAFIADNLADLAMPLVYTPGDNEWTDCHRVNNGAYDPLERLAMLREVFFAQPGRTLGGGRTMHVDAQAELGYPENVDWRAQRVTFAAIHVVGSNDGTLPWTGLGLTASTPEQLAEQDARMAAAIAQVREAFSDAGKRHDRAVVLFLQADMFYELGAPDWSLSSEFAPLVQTIVDESSAFDGPVYLVNGDSHAYLVDQPLVAGSDWLDFYGVEGSADNLTRIQVDGASTATWLKMTIDRHDEDVLSWEVVPFRG